MPKAVRGALVQTDNAQMAMIRKVDAEAGGTIIIEAIDDNTCLVKETKVDELKLRVKQLMDEAMGGEALDSDKDSDLEQGK